MMIEKVIESKISTKNNQHPVPFVKIKARPLEIHKEKITHSEQTPQQLNAILKNRYKDIKIANEQLNQQLESAANKIFYLEEENNKLSQVIEEKKILLKKKTVEINVLEEIVSTLKKGLLVLNTSEHSIQICGKKRV